jgi:hypothetical protein
VGVERGAGRVVEGPLTFERVALASGSGEGDCRMGLSSTVGFVCGLNRAGFGAW